MGVVIFFSKMVGRWNGGEVITGMRNGSICVWTGSKLTKIIANVHAGVCLCSVFFLRTFFSIVCGKGLSKSGA